jgi:succinoglycan biosynthesis transport protein ExoP
MAEPSLNPPPSSGSSGTGDKDEQIVERRSLRDYYIILRERLWIALPLALLVSIGYGYKQSREKPMYSASATIQFEKAERVVTTEGVTDPSVKSDIDIFTNIQVLQSSAMRNRVVASLTPEEIAILQRPYLKELLPGMAPPPPGDLLGNVNIARTPNSLLITISDNNRSAEGSALIANRFVDQFMQRLRENLSGTNEDAVEFLKKRAKELQKESEEKDDALQKYMQLHKLVSLDSSTNIIDARLKEVDERLTAARFQRLDLESQLNQVESFQRDGKNLLEIAAIAAHGSVPSLKGQLDDLTRTQSVLADRYLEQHPRMKMIANQISVVQDQLDQAIALAIADLRTNLAKARETEKTFISENQNNLQESLRLRALAVDFKSLQQQADSSKRSYMEVLDRLAQTTTTKNIEKIPMHTLDRAVPPGGPYAPDLGHIIKTAVGLGMLIFVGVAVGLSFIDDRIKSAWDVEHFIGVNLLGIIPDLSSLKDEDKYSLVLNGKQAPGVESFLSVYSAVKIHSKLDFPKSILITSTIPGEGKTLISCNLAGSFARHGKKTLLVDCDLRRPMLHRHFKQQNNLGIIPWFENGANLIGDLSQDPGLGIIKVGENLSLLCSGGRSKSPTEILESAAFAQLIERLKKQYDLVVVDSPPLGAVTDSLLIAERTDEVIYVCRFNRAYRKHIRLYIKALRSGKNEILGVVLNGLSPRRIEYYSNYRYYRSYKKYYGAQT